MITFNSLNDFKSSRYAAKAKELKRLLDVPWKAPLDKVFNGPLRVSEEMRPQTQCDHILSCGSEVYRLQDGLFIWVSTNG